MQDTEKISIERLTRINVVRENILNLTFRPIYNPFLFFEYWNENNPTNIRYGNNYYANSPYYGVDTHRLDQLSYDYRCPKMMRVRTVIALMVIDRQDAKLKILELPWKVFYEMSTYASIHNLDLGAGGGGDWTLTVCPDEEYIISTDEINTPFNITEKIAIKQVLGGNMNALSEFYKRRILDIKDIVEQLDINPNDPYEYKKDKTARLIKVPIIDLGENRCGEESKLALLELDVLENLVALVDSKEFSNHMEPDMDIQEKVNMNIFMIEAQIEIYSRKFGVPGQPLAEGFRDKMKKEYDVIKVLIDKDDDRFEMIIT